MIPARAALDLAGPIDWGHPLNARLAYRSPVAGASAKRWPDLTGRTAGATLVGLSSLTPCVNGELGVASDGSGNQYGDFGNPTWAAFGSADFSFAMWFRSANLTLGQMVLAQDDLSLGRRVIVALNDLPGSGGIGFVVFTSGGGRRTDTTGGWYTANTWTRLIAQRRRAVSEIQIWVNGVLASTTAIPGTDVVDTATGPLRITQRTYAGNTNSLNGAVAGVTVRNASYTPDEVKEDYRLARDWQRDTRLRRIPHKTFFAAVSPPPPPPVSASFFIPAMTGIGWG